MLKMKKKLVTLVIISLLAITMIFSVTPATAADGDWITNYTVRDMATDEIIMQRSSSGTTVSDNILEGAELKITLTITVPMTVPDSTLKLSTSLQHSPTEDRYWELATTSYSMEGYNPNSQTVTFAQNLGELTITCYGVVPTGMVTSSAGSGTTLHKPFAYELIKLTGPAGETLDQIKPYVIDAKIAEYQVLLDQSKSDLQDLKDQGVAQAYVSLYNNVITGSESAAEEGFVDNAISQLNQLDSTDTPPIIGGSSMADTLFLPISGALAAIAVIGLVLFMRTRGKASYVSQVVEDQIRDLEGLSVRAAKIDKTLSSGLDTIEDRLKRAVGE